MKSLYRKYRPLKLGDVVGQEQVTNVLANAIRENKISHAYLFTGPRGTGKTSVARIFAHAVNNFPYELEDDYVDIIEIDGASNRGIDNIRELREKVMIAPTLGKYKIYIIDEVHMLTKEAFNALLKTLEEPPEHAIFIMATTDAYKVPVTITSRAQIFNFGLADDETMLKHIQKIAEKEQFLIDTAALKMIVKRGGGSFRDTLSILDQISTLSDGKITAEMVNAALGLPEDLEIAKILQAYGTGDVVGPLKDILNSGVRAEVIAEELARAIIDRPESRLMPLLDKLTSVKAPFAEARLLVALVSGCPISAPVSNMPVAEPVATKETVEPRMATTTTATSAAGFDWDAFLKKVKELNDGIATQLKGAKYEFDGNKLTIYPLRKIGNLILNRSNNKQVLMQAAGDVKITVEEPRKKTENEGKDEIISKMSDIMGGEVLDDAGGNPF